MSENPNLVPCPSCAREISKLADFCPQCGHPFRKRGSVFYYVCAVLGSLVLISIIVAIVWSLFASASAAITEAEATGARIDRAMFRVSNRKASDASRAAREISEGLTKKARLDLMQEAALLVISSRVLD